MAKKPTFIDHVDDIHKLTHQARGLLGALICNGNWEDVSSDVLDGCLWLLDDQMKRIKDASDTYYDANKAKETTS